MRFFCQALFMFASFAALAAPNSEQVRRTLLSAPDCGNFVRYDERALYLGFGPYKVDLSEPRPQLPGRVQVRPLDGTTPFELATLDSAVDSLSDGGSLFVLTYSGLEQWNLQSRERVAVFPTTKQPQPLLYKQHAEAFARYGDKVIIAHGRLGVTFFDLPSKKVTHELPLLREMAPRESMATSLTVQGHYAYVGMDNFTLGEGMFRGLIVIDLISESVTAVLPGLDPGVDALVSDAHTLVASFGGQPIWTYDLQAIDGAMAKLPEPKRRVWRFPTAGSPTGRPALDDTYYYTCHWQAIGGGNYASVPEVLARSVLGEP